MLEVSAPALLKYGKAGGTRASLRSPAEQPSAGQVAWVYVSYVLQTQHVWDSLVLLGCSYLQ